MGFLRENTATISNLRVSGDNFDSLAARLMLEKILAANEVLTENAAKREIFCIRTLRDPLPETLLLEGYRSKNSETWNDLLSKEIEILRRRAFRPLIETVPAEAESVVFTDKTEMLACLANDFCDRSIAQFWWWKSLFPNLDAARTIAQIWLEETESVPFALKILHRKKRAAEFVKKLSAGEVKELLIKILQIFGLKKLEPVAFGSFKKEETKKNVFVPNSEKSDKNARFAMQTFSQKSAPFAEIIAETVAADLSFAAETLLAVSLLLANAPRFARSNEFAENLKARLIEREIIENRKVELISDALETKKISKKRETILPAQSASQADAPQNTAQKKNLFTADEKTEFVAPKSSVKPRFIDVEFFRDAQKNDTENVKNENQPQGSKKESPKIEFRKRKFEAETKQKAASKNVKKPKPVNDEAVRQNRAEPAASSPELAETIVFTRFGGVFYLLNLGIFLRLYRDFTENLKDEIDLNIWDFVALVALEIAGAEIKRDSVWRLLENLSGRARGENPGKDFVPPSDWRVPTDWLGAFEKRRDWSYSFSENRLRVCHPANFNVIDVEWRGEKREALNAEIAPYAAFYDSLESAENIDNKEISGFERWLENLTEYICARLSQALNLEKRGELSEVLLRKKAQVNVPPAHLEVNFSLADLPLAVRFSGLDRDPGWIPAVGKFVKFYFK